MEPPCCLTMMSWLMERPRPLPSPAGLVEERIENLFLHLRRNASAVVSDRNFDMITKVFGGDSKPRFMASICFRTALRCSEKAVGNKIQQSPRNVLWE